MSNSDPGAHLRSQAADGTTETIFHVGTNEHGTGNTNAGQGDPGLSGAGRRDLGGYNTRRTWRTGRDNENQSAHSQPFVTSEYAELFQPQFGHQAMLGPANGLFGVADGQTLIDGMSASFSVHQPSMGQQAARSGGLTAEAPIFRPHATAHYTLSMIRGEEDGFFGYSGLRGLGIGQTHVSDPATLAAAGPPLTRQADEVSYLYLSTRFCGLMRDSEN